MRRSFHLIDTGDGLILIDTGYTDTLFLLIDSIYRLGFRPENICCILNPHWHWDHTEGTLFHKFLDHCEARAIRTQEKVKATQEKANAEQL